MTEVDVSNPELLRNIDPIRKAVYDEEGTTKFNIDHLHATPPPDLFGWAEKERGKKAVYEMVGQQQDGSEQWELDVKPLISSTKWLQVHGLHRNRLTMKQILSQIGFKHNDGYVDAVKKPIGSHYGNGLFQQFRRKDGQLYNITVGREKLKQVEESLMRSSHLFKRRLQWLGTGSRRIFGVIQEHCICLVLDVSTMSQTQFDLYRESLCEVIRDQISQLAKFNMIKAQADMVMWQEQATPVTEVTIKSAIEWVQKLDRMAENSRTASMEAILRAMEDDTLEAVYLFAEGDGSDSTKELIRQKVLSAPHPLHTVSFNATKSSTIKFLKEIALSSGGRFHAFVVKSIYEEDSEALPSNAAPPGGDASRISVRLSQKPKGGIPAGAGVRDDVFNVWLELEDCRNNYAQIQSLLTEIPDPKTEKAVIDRPKIPPTSRQEQYMSSRDWLRRHGLEARGVTAFQVLASCSFRHVDGVVDLKGKPSALSASSDAENVRKLVNAKYCNQFAHTKWKDGTIVHVHITAEKHRTYEKKMKTTLDAIQQRIDWLQQGSREVFGTILEEQVYILIDTSQSMKEKLAMLKEKVFQLMQEQLRHKSKFNFVKFDTKAVAWKDRAVDVTEQNLLNAWNWVKDIGVGGSTNTLAALRIALSDPYTHAIYLLTDGRPDQSQQMFWMLLQNPKSVLAQVQLQHSVPIHTIAFNCNDMEANKFLYQLSEDTGGRYHNFSSDGGLPEAPPPFESEDVSLLKKELDRGKKDLEKISRLRARCVMLDWFHNKQQKSFNHSRSSSANDLELQPYNGTNNNNNNSADVPSRPHSSQGFYRSPTPPKTKLSIAHKNHRGSAGVNDRLFARRRRKAPTSASHKAGHTRTSMLRLAASGNGELSGWMLPESREFMEEQINKSMSAYQDIMRSVVEKKNRPVKKKKEIINPLDVPNAVWLKKHGLVARKLTVMDVLTPTVVKVTPKYIPVLDSHVVSKVFNDVLPIAHVSPRSRQEVRLVNPSAVDLPAYDEKLKAAISEYKQRLDLIVWRNLNQEERDKFEDGPVSYIDHQEALHQAMDRLGWPINQQEIQVLLDEIHLGERYLQQSRDLQRTAKEVGMGKKKKKEKQQSKKEELEEKSDSSSISSEMSEKPIEEKKKPFLPKKSSGFTKGQKVIARDETDGFYYDAVVVKCTDARHVLIQYNHDGEEIVPTRFVFPSMGAVSCPPLKVGDQALAYSTTDSDVPCYVPAMIVGTPRRTQVRDKFYTVLKFDNRKLSLLRKHLFKISETQYKFAMRYVKNAQLIDRTVPSVDFVAERQPISDDSSLTSSSDDESPANPKVVDVVMPSTATSGDSSSSSASDKPTPKPSTRRKKLTRQKSIESQTSTSTTSSGKVAKITKDDMESIKRNLDKLQSQLVETMKEQLEQKQILQQQSEDLEIARQQFQEMVANEPRKQIAHQSVNTENDDLTKSPNTDVFSSSSHDSSRPITSPTEFLPSEHSPTPPRQQPTPKQTKPDEDVSLSVDGNSLMVTKGDEGIHISRNPPTFIDESQANIRDSATKLKPGEEVLHRCHDDGWYYRGTVKQSYPNDSYDVTDNYDITQNTFREDIITDKDDASNILKDDDFVVALHPEYPSSYAPASIAGCLPEDWFNVKFYDNTMANVARDEIYKLGNRKYKKDVDYINKCENKWVGEAVVARSDHDGQYHLASCVKRVGNGHQYALQWADGSSGVQNLSCMFGAPSKQRKIRLGDYLLAVADRENLIYLPGRVAAVNGNKLTVVFCNRSRFNNVNSAQCFWISKEYHDLAVAFYRSKQVAGV